MTFPDLTVEFAPGFTWSSASPTWVEIAASRILDVSWSFGTRSELSEFPPGEATITIENDDRLFDPDNSSGTYYGDLLPRVPVRIRASSTAPEELTISGDSLTISSEDVTVGVPTVVDLFYGFVEDGWEQTLQPPIGMTCTIRLVDLLGVLVNHPLPSVLESEILADSPVAYWPLDEGSGRVMRDASGNGHSGTYSADITSLAASIEPLDGGTVPAIHFRDEHRGFYDQLSARLTTQPATVEMVLQQDAESDEGGHYYIPFRQGSGNSGDGIAFNIGSAGLSGVGYDHRLFGRFMWAGVNFAATPAGSFTIGEPHHVLLQIVSTTTTLYLDNVGYTATEIGTSGDNFFGTAIGNGSLSTSHRAFEGRVGYVALYDSTLSAARRDAHYEAFTEPLSGLRSDEQIQWVLDQLGVPAGLVNLDQGVSIMGPLDTAGRDALDLIRLITATEAGDFYVDHHGGGVLRFRNRYSSWEATRSTVTQATFSDDPTASDTAVVRVDPDTLVIEPNGVKSIVNTAEVSWRGGVEVTRDATSVAAYGPRRKTIGTVATSPLIAQAVGQWEVAQGVTPRTRVKSFTWTPSDCHEFFDEALDLRVGDLVDFRLQPTSTGTVVTRELEVRGGGHQVRGRRWTTSLFVTEAPSASTSLFTLGTSQLGGADVLAY